MVLPLVSSKAEAVAITSQVLTNFFGLVRSEPEENRASASDTKSSYAPTQKSTNGGLKHHYTLPRPHESS